jgi:hypothetical protein
MLPSVSPCAWACFSTVLLAPLFPEGAATYLVSVAVGKVQDLLLSHWEVVVACIDIELLKPAVSKLVCDLQYGEPSTASA